MRNRKEANKITQDEWRSEGKKMSSGKRPVEQ
jgi:hypothetical protein